MKEKITRDEEREAYEQYLNTLNAMSQKEIDGLKAKLALSTEREERLRSEFDACMRHSLKRDEEMTKYRKALEWIVMDCEMFKGMSGMEHRDMNYLSAIKQRSETALSSSPAPEPVTVEELAQEIASAHENTILKDSFYLNTAKHLLTKFKMEKKP